MVVAEKFYMVVLQLVRNLKKKKINRTLDLFKLLGNPKCVEELLENGADYQFKDDRKRTALDYARTGAAGLQDEYDTVFKIDYKNVVKILEKAESLNQTGEDLYESIFSTKFYETFFPSNRIFYS